jgi:hypothetical protein
MGFQSAPEGLCGCWIGEVDELRAARTLVSAEVEAGAALANAFREGHGRSQSTRRHCVREHDSVEGG